MKIEMGESLFYSWLRHVKECQVVQTNWKPSSSWQLHNEDAIKQFMDAAGGHYQNKYGYNLYKNSTFSQFLKQAEIDALGICITGDGIESYAVDVAFHESGLQYGDHHETVARVIKKLVRTALCMVGYLGVTKGLVVFASPKINTAVVSDLEPCIADLNFLFFEHGYEFAAKLIANDDFNNLVLQPVLIASSGVSDTSELFMRSYQLTSMFTNEHTRSQMVTGTARKTGNNKIVPTDVLSELKIGKIAQIFLRKVLEAGAVTQEEVVLLQKKEYSKKVFGIDFPLLVLANTEYDSARYYATPLVICGISYKLCSQWFEVAANNDRPLLMAWLEEHDAFDNAVTV